MFRKLKEKEKLYRGRAYYRETTLNNYFKTQFRGLKETPKIHYADNSIAITIEFKLNESSTVYIYLNAYIDGTDITFRLDTTHRSPATMTRALELYDIASEALKVFL